MLPWYIKKLGAYCVGRVQICYFCSVKIMGAYCVGRVPALLFL